MQALIFCGVQASGKTTFYAERLLKTHVRIGMDLMRTRQRERRFLETCLQSGQRFVVDNTNPTAGDRRPYLEAAKAARYEVVSYYFETSPEAALARNARRDSAELIPVAGVLGTFKRLQPPTPAEGYDAMYSVHIAEVGGFVVSETAA